MRTALYVLTVIGIALILYGAWRGKRPATRPRGLPPSTLQRPPTQQNPTVDLEKQEETK